MNFEKMPIIATGNVPNGYFGERLDVDFVFCAENGKTYIKHHMGYCQSLVNVCIDIREAQWQLKNHPLCAKYYKNITILDNSMV